MSEDRDKPKLEDYYLVYKNWHNAADIDIWPIQKQCCCLIAFEAMEALLLHNAKQVT